MKAAPGKVMPIVALVLPLLCLWPVGLVLAIISFVRAKGHPRALPVAAIVTNVVVGVIVVLAVAFAPETSASLAADGVTQENAHAIADALEREVDDDLAAASR